MLFRSRAYCEIHVWRGYLQLLEKDIGHVDVVVLAGVDKSLFLPRVLDRPENGCGLHEVRSSAYYVKYVHD